MAKDQLDIDPYSKSAITGHGTTTEMPKGTMDDGDSDKGNFLNNLDKEEGSFSFGDDSDKEDQMEKLFALGDSQLNYDRAKRNFTVAQSRQNNNLEQKHYVLNTLKRQSEMPLE